MSLDEALAKARSLNEPREVNAEYARGQAELICMLFGLSMYENYSYVFKIITHELTMESRRWIDD